MMDGVRFFTRGWHSGEVPDHEAEQVWRDYAAHLEAILPCLSKPMIVLATDVNLHDAVIEGVEWAPAERRLVLHLIARPPAGPPAKSISLAYTGAMLGEQQLETLRQVARDRASEILYSEVDCDDDGVLLHRLLIWPRDELSIAFRSLALEQRDRADSRVHLGGYFVEVQPDA